MSTYYEYELEKGLTVLIEGPDNEIDGFTPAANTLGAAIVKTRKSFNTAFKSVNAQAKKIIQNLDDLAADEVKVKFGLTTVGELGNFAVGKLGVEINYEVTLKWVKNQTAIKSRTRKS